ncbi:MAG TPA: thioredoxin [Acholeplasmataceae bacterium]|nr:thioredoxin [Acholeplasmataceae bacterium]
MHEYTGQPFNDLLKENNLVLVQYYADWCNPCQMLKPILEELSTELTNIKFYRVDIEEYRDLAVNANVQSIPTVVLFKDGEEVGREKGFKPKHLMETWIKKTI